MDKKEMNRRGFLKMVALTLVGAAAGAGRLRRGLGAASLTDETPALTPQAYLPAVVRSGPTQTPEPTSTPVPTQTPEPTSTPMPTSTPQPGVPLVVHVHSPSATSWNFGDDYYGTFVDQDVVNAMVDRGVRDLTGASTVAQAWQLLVPGYTPGRAIAIKANFNNSIYCGGCLTDCEEFQLKIDALIHPINAVVRGLKAAYSSFDAADVWVYDASPGPSPPLSDRKIPDRFTDGCLHQGVRFFDRGCREPAAYESADPTSWVSFSPPQGIPTPPAQKVTDVLVAATYVINMPIIKRHGGAGVTLSLKNHFGSIHNCPPLHDWTCFNWPARYYSDIYNPLLDIYRNPHVGGKTVLTIGDGLFGDRESNVSKPTPWDTFGGQAANSLFFATDPVALDSVMCDFLDLEGFHGGIYEGSDDYLRLAEAAGLGVFERGDPWQEPWGSGYSRITYRRVEL
jgi:hypothetical protein